MYNLCVRVCVCVCVCSQGYLSTQRRNYNKTFNQLANVLASTSDPRAQLLLVGKQDDNPKNWPVVPDSVAKRTKVISNLK